MLNIPFAPLISLITTAAALMQTPSEEPKVRHGHNPATVERSSATWKLAALEVNRSTRVQRSNSVSIEGLPKLIRGGKSDPYLSLTFDDGPHPTFTLALIDILKREGVPATFFVVGKMGERYPELLRAITDNGFTIANHTYSHVTLTDLNLNDVETEYQANNDLIFAATGERPRYCRPPGGRYDDMTVKAAAKLGMTTVLWTDDPGDYNRPDAATLEKKTFAKLNNGGIILLHSGVQSTLDTLPDLIHIAKKKGFRFVTLDQLGASLDREEAVHAFAVKKHREQLPLEYDLRCLLSMARRATQPQNGKWLERLADVDAAIWIRPPKSRIVLLAIGVDQHASSRLKVFR